MNKKQTWMIRLWLVLVTTLALFPPFEITKKNPTLPYPFQGSTRHEFVLHGGDTPINIPSFGDNLEIDFEHQRQVTPHILSKTIGLSTLLCELIVLTALTGFVCLSLKGNDLE